MGKTPMRIRMHLNTFLAVGLVLALACGESGDGGGSDSDCEAEFEVSCDDGVDNDCDGDVDEADVDCSCACLDLAVYVDAILETCPDGTVGDFDVINCDADVALPDYTEGTDFCAGRPNHEEVTVNLFMTPTIKTEYFRTPGFDTVDLSCITATQSSFPRRVPEPEAAACLEMIRAGCGLISPR